ncbi:uncharacterized protein LOC133806483 [Humulus lupulus]|uniref:uncharacterized protein LOC133806483 n=1 Tax=Humulus lupulus TaxID=3486 RepID=UPI002B415790|nr:uncharacterized protein LOC133806483 [Humulus lupulus]
MSNYYHPGLRNHENFSYVNSKNVLQPPPGFSAQPQAEKKSSLEDILGTFMMETSKRFNKNEARLDNIETHMSNVGATMKTIEVQVEQLATTIASQQKGNFPGDTILNPEEKGKAIYMRSGKGIEGGVTEEKRFFQGVDNKIKSELVVREIEKEETVEKNSINEKPTTKKDNLPMNQPPLPYHQGFLKKKHDEQFSKFLEIFKKININTPFFDALEKIPNYVKFMKEVFSKKRKFEDYETVKHTEEFFKKLGLWEVKPITITLQLVDCSLTYPHGVIENVLVKVDKFVFPANFGGVGYGGGP